ncbi:MAG TPA: metal ABC transporter substrate-binding protein [Acidimicrobiia bacterium]|nr:metal ABC transporter substrate-binding protein [Acidimicrobiia bacterium]
MPAHILIALLLLAVTIAGCGSDAGDGRPRVVVTTTILGDLVTAIAGDDAAVTVLVPRGADPHDFSPSAQQMTRIGEADLVVLNGLGLEEGLEAAIAETADPEAVVLAIAALVDPIPFAEHDGGETVDLDPHVWLDPVRMAAAAELVGAALEQLDPDGGYDERAAQYAAELMQANDAVEELLAAVPTERRLLVTNHESMNYFAARYGFRIVGVVIPGGSTLAEPSSAELAALVATIQTERVTAIFAETTHPTDLAAAIAAEAGTEVVVVELFTESLGDPGSAAATLVGMLVENARRIAAALGG